MPEGDTIHRTAATLRAALAGRRLERVEFPRAAEQVPVGTSVVDVEARGKHLLVWFGDGRLLHSHLRLHGAWHLYVPGERWRKPPGAARAVLAVSERVAVCFNAPVTEVLDAAALARHPALRRLGPDLCRPDADLDAAVERLAALPEPDAAVGDVLLDQRVAAGIGNVYRCETLFLEGLHPDTALHAVPPATRHRLLATASRLLRANLDGQPRVTVPDAPPGTLWVYDRGGRPCRRCGAPVAVEHRGDQARVTYWCPGCQPAAHRLTPGT